MNPLISFLASAAGRVVRILAGIALVAWGALRYFVSRTWRGRVLGITIAVLNVGSMGVVWLAWPLVFNQLVIGRLGGPLYNARAGLLTLVGATALAVMAAAAFTGARRGVRVDRDPDVGPARIRSPFEVS